MPEARVIKMRLSLNGRPLNSYKFSKDVIMVGRDQYADVHVDNPGVSREHLKFELTQTGEYRLVDLGSANGTYLNDDKVKAAYVRNGDLVRFGKYTLWIGIEADRRKRSADGEQNPVRVLDQATTILSPAELERLMSASREKEREAMSEPEPVMAEPAASAPVSGPKMAPKAAQRSGSASVLVWVMIILGTALGAGATWLFLR